MKKESKVCKEIVPAERLSSVSEYYFSKKLKEVAAMNAAGKNIISLGIGSPDLPPSPEAIKTLCEQSSLATTHGYQAYVGIPELREAFAAWYRKWYSVELNPTSEIQPLIGSKEGILHISMAFLNPGDEVLVPNPGYPTYTSVTKLVGATPVFYDLEESSSWTPNFDYLESLDLTKVKLMWINYPHMPTGARGSLQLFEQVVAFAKKHGIVVVNDNPYSFILNNKPLSLLQVEGAKEVCIELNSMSKSHNMPGWRMAMLASNETFVSWVLKVKSNIDSGQFKPMMLAAAKALSSGSEWYEKMNKVYADRRVLAEQILQLLHCSYDAEQTGLFLWGKVPDTVADGASLADTLLYEAGVFVTPGFIFGSKGTAYIRLSLCCNEAILQEAIDRIKQKITL